jgi:hypothetical protein
MDSLPLRCAPAGNDTESTFTSHVIAGLVPVISMQWSAAFQMIGMAGTSPAMT